jgi:hypothetical protein
MAMIQSGTATAHAAIALGNGTAGAGLSSNANLCPLYNPDPTIVPLRLIARG